MVDGEASEVWHVGRDAEDRKELERLRDERPDSRH